MSRVLRRVPVIQRLQGTRPNLFANLLVKPPPSPPERMVHDSEPVWIPAGAAAPSLHGTQHLTGARYTQSAKDISRHLPLEVWGPHSPAGLPGARRNKPPSPRFRPVFTALFPVLTSHIFQDSLFGWALG